MQGQDAVNVAQAFNEALPLTGVVLTKLDGDARGGAALSVRQVTGKPIKFVGVGEKLNGTGRFTLNGWLRAFWVWGCPVIDRRRSVRLTWSRPSRWSGR